MLTRSFCCFRGISNAAERRIWQQGCWAWSHLALAGRALSRSRAANLAVQVAAAEAALRGRVADFFLSRLPVGHRLRAWPDFCEGVAFLDVETTGLSARDEMTVLGVRIAGEMHSFVRDRDMWRFMELWRRIDILVTFNGARFDLPVLGRTFGLRVMPPHIDLLHESRAHGFNGGLKNIERLLGIRRTPEEEGDGAEAVRLWRQYAEAADPSGLERLMRYNARDVQSLVVLARELLRRSFDAYPGPLPKPPR